MDGWNDDDDRWMDEDDGKYDDEKQWMMGWMVMMMKWFLNHFISISQ